MTYFYVKNSYVFMFLCFRECSIHISDKEIHNPSRIIGKGLTKCTEMSLYNLFFQTVSIFSYVYISMYSLIPGEQGGSSFFNLEFFATSAHELLL
jgi:hypothetical protein